MRESNGLRKKASNRKELRKSDVLEMNKIFEKKGMTNSPECVDR